MTITTSILAIVAAAVPFLIWLWKRRATRTDDPEARYQKARDENAKAIAKGDSNAVNVRLDDRLRRLPYDPNKNNPGR